MLKVHVKYHLKPGTRDAFLAGITEKTLQDAVLHEDGCLKYDYSPVADDPDQVLLEEEWTSPPGPADPPEAAPHGPHRRAEGPVHGPHGPGHGGALSPPP